ncbi:YcaO-like family protein [Catenulispora rubra]|uniref:YcaO-like family protein n=1 Tax=Catenulispora rubra TaxID=280293 RepID=UPI0018923D02|nr:YcaO-like family protein [Catenulispora rubra]
MVDFPPVFERTVSTVSALSSAQSEIDRLGFHAYFRTFDETEYTTSYCELEDAHGNVRSRAAGKGNRHQSEVGSYFEALEHFYSAGYTVDRREQSGAALATARKVAAQPALAKNRMIQNLATEYPDAQMGVVEMHRYTTAEPLLYPIFPTDARYWDNPLPGDELEYEQYLNYQGTSGSAAGVNHDEALLHAVGEIVERDAQSLALIEWFCVDKPHVRLIEPASLTGALADVYQAVREAAEHGTGDVGGRAVRLVDITSDLGIPVVMAVLTRPGDQASLCGLGCSISPGYAAYRAMTELIQGCHALSADPEFHLGEQRALERLADWPVLGQMLRCDLDEVLSRAVVTEQPLRRPPIETGTLTLDSALTFLQTTLEHHGFEIYWRPVAAESEHISVVTVAVPGLEDFAKITHGYPVTPTGRGWDRWVEIFGLSDDDLAAVEADEAESGAVR